MIKIPYSEKFPCLRYYDDLEFKAEKDLYFILDNVMSEISDIIRVYAVWKYDKEYVKSKGFKKEDYKREIRGHAKRCMIYCEI